jgi:hypothetical protein
MHMEAQSAIATLAKQWCYEEQHWHGCSGSTGVGRESAYRSNRA